MDFRTRLKMLNTVLDIIEYLQKLDLCHLDLKPSNFLLNMTSGKWNKSDFVLADFGIANALKHADGLSGTPGFGSPEQFIGKPSKKSDNYILGKLIITIIYPWNDAWNLMQRPITHQELKKQPLYNTPAWAIISDLLQVILRN